ncbi:MAG TPA: hypothetical protein VER79_08650, partial [Candidatus Limnocylindrales bacterium]|nr:hypothetical protein [Candidatus Limnocylindrales bacterium]
EGSSETDTGTFDGESNTWNVGDLAVGQSATLIFDGYVNVDCNSGIFGMLYITTDTPNSPPQWVDYSAIPDCVPAGTQEPFAQDDIEFAPEVTDAVTPEATLEVTEEAAPEATLEVTEEAAPSEATPEATEPPVG